MALVAMAVWDTEENKRTWMTRDTLMSLKRTVDFSRHRLIISDNGSCEETQRLYEEASLYLNFTLIKNGENLGTAKAVNKAWVMRQPNENAVKMDNDVVIRDSGWLDVLEEVVRRDPKTGICGLKRKDLMESPTSADTAYRSTLRMLPHKEGQEWIVVEDANHIMGTCLIHSAALLNRIGFLSQPGVYGFDDSLTSVRARAAGFTTSFLPHIRIDHIDTGKTSGGYTQWKRDLASSDMATYNKLKAQYISGALPLRCDVDGVPQR